MDCDLKIIGISNTDCECFEKDTEESLSGVFLNELDGFSLQKVKDTEICELGDWNEHCEIAINNATTQLYADVLKKIQNTKKFQKAKKIEGLLGSINKVQLMTTNKKYLVYRLALKPLKYTKLKIKNIGLYFENANPMTAQIINPFGTVIQTITLTPQAKTYKLQAVDIELPFSVTGVPYAEYYIKIDISNNNPYELKHLCCGDTYRFNYSEPCFYKYTNGWRSLMMWDYHFVDTFDIQEIRECIGEYYKYMGITLDYETICNTQEIICSQGIDYTQDLGISIALAIRYKTASIVYTDILNRPNVDQTEVESTLALIQFWDNKYNMHIGYISDVECDCFERITLLNSNGARI
jgi:hypothetical protein